MDHEQAGKWIVLRHGGRRTDNWRVACVHFDEELARKCFAEIHHELRQGAVKLIDPMGVTVRTSGAPLLRTRW